MHGEFGKLVRFGLVGLVNTAIGYLLFLMFFFLAEFSAPVSNTLSYLIAVFVAFFLYRNFQRI